jgi:hypothetical protein
MRADRALCRRDERRIGRAKLRRAVIFLQEIKLGLDEGPYRFTRSRIKHCIFNREGLDME